jgi:hypothetical protein
MGGGAAKLEMEIWTEGSRLLRVDIPTQMLTVLRDDIATVAARVVTMARPNDEEVTIPANAGTKYVRNGRIYGLDSAQNVQAEDRLKRQGATGVDDFFEEATGQPVSNAVKLPY